MRRRDRCTHASLCQSLTLAEAATASFIPHPSFSAPPPLSVLLADWGISTSTDWEQSYSQTLSSVCLNDFSLWTRVPGHQAPPPGRCILISKHSRVMYQGPVGDGRGIWVSGRFSWLMCVWTRRNGMHHQHCCVWWAAHRLRKEL